MALGAGEDMTPAGCLEPPGVIFRAYFLTYKPFSARSVFAGRKPIVTIRAKGKPGTRKAQRTIDA